METAKFATVRLVPDLVRGDCLNVGIIVESSQGTIRRCLFARKLGAAAQLWPDLDLQAAHAYIDGLKGLIEQPERQPTLGEHVDHDDQAAFDNARPDDEISLEHLAEIFGNVIQIGEVREFAAMQPLHEEAERLYRMYVGDVPKPESVVRFTKHVRDALKAANLIRDGALQKVQEPIKGKRETHKVEYLGQNGRTHLVGTLNLRGTRALKSANAFRGEFRDLVTRGSSYEQADFHTFIDIPLGQDIEGYAPSAVLLDEPGIIVHPTIASGIESLREVFAGH